jgi:hypothetical protein
MMLRRILGRRDPAPKFLPYAERPALAAALEAYADCIVTLWSQDATAELLTQQEADGLALIAGLIRKRAERIRLLGR